MQEALPGAAAAHLLAGEWLHAAVLPQVTLRNTLLLLQGHAIAVLLHIGGMQPALLGGRVLPPPTALALVLHTHAQAKAAGEE